jgi:hypothetical protein
MVPLEGEGHDDGVGVGYFIRRGSPEEAGALAEMRVRLGDDLVDDRTADLTDRWLSRTVTAVGPLIPTQATGETAGQGGVQMQGEEEQEYIGSVGELKDGLGGTGVNAVVVQPVRAQAPCQPSGRPMALTRSAGSRTGRSRASRSSSTAAGSPGPAPRHRPCSPSPQGVTKLLGYGRPGPLA